MPNSRILVHVGKELRLYGQDLKVEQRFSLGGGSFSIGIAQATKSLTPGSPFRPADLKSERISVYRAENGRRTFSITVRNAPSDRTKLYSVANR